MMSQRVFILLVVFCFGLMPTFSFGQYPTEDPIELDDPNPPLGSTCFRTKNDSCNQHVNLDANRPRCSGRQCGWTAITTDELDENGNPTGNTVTEYVLGCQTPIGEKPFEEEYSPVEVPNVEEVFTGGGREKAKKAEQVFCVERMPCLCDDLREGDTCERADEKSDDDGHAVIGWVIDTDSNACQLDDGPGPGPGPDPNQVG